MITVHVDLLDRFNRAIPGAGLLFLAYQARVALIDAKNEDRIFVEKMTELGGEIEDRLRTHSQTQEWFLIRVVLAVLVATWCVMWVAAFASLALTYWLVLTTLIAMVADYIGGKLALSWFNASESA